MLLHSPLQGFLWPLSLCSRATSLPGARRELIRWSRCVTNEAYAGNESSLRNGCNASKSGMYRPPRSHLHLQWEVASLRLTADSAGPILYRPTQLHVSATQPLEPAIGRRP
jgi:hypothetical protein